MKFNELLNNDVFPFEKYKRFTSDQISSIYDQLNRIKINDDVVNIVYGAVNFTLNDVQQKKDSFVKRLEFICSEQFKLMNNDNKQDMYCIYDSYSKSFHNTLSVLENITKGNLPIMFDRKFYSELSDDEITPMHYSCKSDEYFNDCLTEACEAYNHLNKLKKLIDNKKESLKNKQRGPEKALHDNFTATIRYIACDYETYLGVRPTMYNIGPFFNIIRIVCEYFERPKDEPTKTIRQALKIAGFIN